MNKEIANSSRVYLITIENYREICDFRTIKTRNNIYFLLKTIFGPQFELWEQREGLCWSNKQDPSAKAA